MKDDGAESRRYETNGDFEDAGFSAYVRRKAEALVAKGGMVRQDPEYPEVWWVVGSDGSERRLQFVADWVICTCTHGLNNPGRSTCYHALSVLLTRQKGRSV